MADAAALTGFSTALAGAAQGFERGQELAAKDEERKQQRELFRQQKRENDLKLKEMYSPNAVKTREQELEIQLKEQKEKLEQFDKQATMQTLDKTMLHHDQSGNWNSFNEALKGPQGERINRMIGGGKKVINVTGADITSKEDHTAIVEAVRKLSPEELEKASPGLVDTDKDGTISKKEMEAVANMSNEQLLSGIDSKAFKKRFGRFTMDDGSVEFKDIITLWARTGYGEYTDEKTRQKQLKSVELRQAEANVKLTEAKADGTDGGSDLTTTQKEARAVAEAKARVKDGTASGADKELIAAWNKKTDMTDRATKAYMAKDERDEKNIETLDKLNYDGTAEPTTEEGQDALRQLKKDYPLKGEPEKLAMKFSSLVDLGAKGSGLNEEQTGVISDLLTKAETYYSEAMPDSESARSAYLQYQTGIKHLLYGSALTATEIESFNQAYGNLGLSTGAILSKFRTSLESLQKEAEAAERNPNVNKHVWNSAVGEDKKKLAETIHNIKIREEQLRMLKAKRSKADIEKYAKEHPFKPKLSPAEQKKKTLDTIFKQPLAK